MRRRGCKDRAKTDLTEQKQLGGWIVWALDEGAKPLSRSSYMMAGMAKVFLYGLALWEVTGWRGRMFHLTPRAGT